MTIKLYRTTKRRNSTATPVSKPALFELRATITADLKDESNILTPSFLLNMTGHDGSNYVEAFGRYYWIKDFVIVRASLFQLNCAVDVLASYRGRIRATRAFVLYDSVANTELPDHRLAIKTTPTVQTSQALMPWSFVQGSGTNFIAVSGNGKNTDAAGSTGVYTITPAGLSDLGFQVEDLLEAFDDQATAYDNNYQTWMDAAQAEMDGILTDPTRAIPHAIIATLYIQKAILGAIKTFFIDGLINFWKGIVKLFTGGDALKNVRAAYWLPFIVPTSGMTSYTKLALGGFVETITGGLNKVTDPIIADSVSVSIPWQFSDWRNVSCTEIQMYIPLIGVISIPASAVKGQSTITVYCSLNLYSGLFSVRLTCGGATLGTFGIDCRMPIMVGDSNVNTGAIVNAIAAGAAAIATGGTTAAAAGLWGAAVASGIESISPINTTVGGIGGGAGSSLGSNIICATICHGTSQEPSSLRLVIGTPTNQLLTLNGLSANSYCQTANARLNTVAVAGESYPTESEIAQVEQLLDSGVYLE